MRQWRVGTLSMGLVLVGSGVGLLYAGINNRAVVDAVLKWWPLVFVLLGLEVLCLTFLNRDQAPVKVSYDVFSILIIIVLVGFGLGFQALNETGVAEKIKKELTYGQYQLKTETNEISLGSGVKKIVIEAPPYQLAVHSGRTNTVSAYAHTMVRAASEENARKLASRDNVIASHVFGQAQYISFNVPSGEDINIQDLDIFIPQNIDVEIHNPNSAHIYADEVNNNWKIDGGGNIEVSLSQQVNLEITALMTQGPEGPEPGGNVPWKVTEVKQGNSENNTGEIRKMANVKLGTGANKMNLILNGGSITVNQM